MTNNTTIRQMVQWVREDVQRLEVKVDKLQKFRWLAIGYGSAFGTIAGIAVTILIRILT